MEAAARTKTQDPQVAHYCSKPSQENKKTNKCKSLLLFFCNRREEDIKNWKPKHGMHLAMSEADKINHLIIIINHVEFQVIMARQDRLYNCSIPYWASGIGSRLLNLCIHTGSKLVTAKKRIPNVVI